MIVMNVFSGNFGAIVDAVFQEQDRKTPLGAVDVGSEHNVKIIIDQSYTNNWQSNMISQTSDVLVYGQSDSVLAEKTCVGGTLKVGTQTFRIETFAVATNQRTGAIAHVELGCSEL